MKTFKVGQRVTATEGKIAGLNGTVIRRCINMNEAWIRFDQDLPDEYSNFPKEDGRHRDVRLPPTDCKLLGGK
ncbi:MAG: hypothetical protein KAR20_11380 [Candidatus Heimdallarchaeota archaeon]|nr:hypothetical protein [Candidatus Heimdallarchaeota archaeon]